MSERIVLDASAVLALLHREPGHDIVTERIVASAVAMSAVNAAEVVSKQRDIGIPESESYAFLQLIGIDIHPFEEQDVLEVGRLRSVTRPLGLSLGDRACLALGKRLNGVVLTADRSWLEADCAVELVTIR